MSSRLLAWSVLARAALSDPRPVADALARADTGVEQAAEQFASRRAGPRSHVTLGELAARDLEAADAIGARLLTRDAAEWADSGFDDLPPLGNRAGAPVAVWMRGAWLNTGEHPRVAVVGSREVSARGARITGEIVTALAEHGCPIISGGARGIDTLAHQRALTHCASTIAVVATGRDRVYPAENSALFEAITETGSLLSEYPPGTPPSREKFLARNRLVAALSGLLVIPEARHRSGTLTTAGWARRLHRPVLAVPGPAHTAASAGCDELITAGHATATTTVTQVIAATTELDRPEATPL